MEPDRRTPPQEPAPAVGAGDPAAPRPEARDDTGAAEASTAGGSRSDRVDAVRRAVDQALAATAGAPRSTRARAQELVDELGGVVHRFRGAIEELGSAGTTQAGALADEVQQAVGRLGRSLDDARPATGDDLRRLTDQLERLERRVARLEASGTGAPPTAAD